MKNLSLEESAKNHFEAIKNKRIEEIINSYIALEDLLVFVEGPRWATVGFENVSKGWHDFIASAISLEKCEWVEYLTSKIVGEMGFVAGIVELTVNIKGETKTIRFRGTFVWEKDAQEGNWKIIHEHFSQPAEDPYGIGDWLK